MTQDPPDYPTEPENGADSGAASRGPSEPVEAAPPSELPAEDPTAVLPPVGAPADPTAISPTAAVAPDSTAPSPSRGPWTYVALGAVAVLLLVGIPLVLLLSGDDDTADSTIPPVADDTTTTIAATTTTEPTDTSTTTEPADTTTTSTTTTSSTTTTTVASTTTTTAPSTTTTLAPAVEQTRVYLIGEADQTSLVEGFVLRSEVVLGEAAETPVGALEALVEYSSQDGVEDSAIPRGTRLLGVNVEDTVATVDLSADFEDGDEAALRLRLAQVVFTATQFANVDGVLFEIEGSPFAVSSSEGDVLDRPATREDFVDVLPLVFLDAPANLSTVNDGLIIVTGIANAFEATVAYEVATEGGTILDEGFTTATCGTGCWGEFEFVIEVSAPEDVPESGRIVIRVFENSANDGSVINLTEHIVTVVSPTA